MMAATFTVIDALEHSKLGFYDQEKREYQEMTVDSPNEIAICTCNISMKDGRPFVYVHAVRIDKNGNTSVCHLFEGIIFATEVHIRELRAKIERKCGKTTVFLLWDTE